MNKYGECNGRLTNRRHSDLNPRLVTGITPPPNQHLGHPPRMRMDLDHFVCACVVVRQMCELHDRCTGGGPGAPGQGQSRVSRDEFLEAVISLP